MITTLEKEITFRYLKTRKKDGFLNIISIFSFIGISLGVAVLIIVMSVMNGFRTELINKIVGFNPHATLEFYGGKNDLKTLKNSKIKNKIKNTIISNYSEGIILTRSNDSNNYQNKTKGIMLRGYLLDQFRNLSIINNEDYFGKKKLLQDSISIGEELSINLNLNIGDKVAIMSPTGIQTIIGSLPKQKIFTVTSIYKSGLADFDNNIAFINLNTLEDLFDVDKKNRKLEIYFFEPKEIENLKIELVKLFEMNNIYTWSDMNSSLFSALKVERNVMFIILSLIIIVAAFNIISGLTILVKNKTRDIAILKSIGVLNKSIVKIFFFVGVIIGTSATFFGIILGVLFSLYVENIREFLSNTFNIGLFPEEIYFLSKMPSEINFTSIFIISFSSILITTIVSIFPAIKAARLDTVKALKYE